MVFLAGGGFKHTRSTKAKEELQRGVRIGNHIAQMNWASISERFATIRSGGTDLQKRIRGLRRRLTLLLAVVGPGLITSNVDNDAGGISDYTQAGAQYGYALLWSLIPMTIALYVTEEMCARMGVVTGKGLSDLIREEFGFRPTFFVMITGFLVDLANVVAEFAGVAAAMEIFHVSKYIAVPIAAILVWVLVLRGTYRQVEVIFLVACGFYVTYIISAMLAKPDWLVAAKAHRDSHHPFQFRLPADAHRLDRHHHRAVAIFLSAGWIRGEKSRSAPVSAGARGRAGRQHQLHGDRVSSSSFAPPRRCTPSGQRDITEADDAARALIPLAGSWAGYLVRLWFAERVALRRFHSCRSPPRT